MTEQTKRRAYAPPRLTVHGSLEAITKGAATGTSLDAAFTRGTPLTELTFS